MEITEVASGLVKRLAGKGPIVPTGLDLSGINEGDLDAVAGALIRRNADIDGIHIVTRKELDDIISSIRSDKIPFPIEVAKPSDYKPLAKELGPVFSIRDYDLGFADGNVDGFVSYFNDRLAKIKGILKQRETITGTLKDISLIKEYNDGKEVCIIGMIKSKQVTKNNNLLVGLEDESGSAKVVFTNTPQNKENLYDKAYSLVYDEVVAVRGKIYGALLIANALIWPDIPIKTHKQVDEDLAIAFISDVHFGSKNFMDKGFRNMVAWLNGNIDKDKRIAEKIKYLIIGGDVADGIGVYPGQEKDLAIKDMNAQYNVLADYLEAIPDYIQVFVLPGNHDSVQRAEPQPSFPVELIDLKMNNVHFVPNPSYMNIHGLDVLSYHGTSLDSVIRSIPNNSYSKPEKAMEEVLKRRHLSPIYGGNIVVPSKKDNLVIDVVPDILHMGHIHKVGMSTYHGVSIVNSGTWQGRTEFQIKQGHIPTPCLMPVLEMKKYKFSYIDFGN